MIRSIFILAFCSLSIFLSAQDVLNLRKIGAYDRGDTAYSGSWIYVNDAGEEYGLVGANTGTAIYPLEEGMDDELAFIPGPTSRWREITVIEDHAYITTEGNGVDQGLQVLSLGGLPDTAFLLTTFDSTFTKGHILQKDQFNPEEPYIYVSGTDSTGAVHILDVSDPSDPIQVGLHDTGAYIHDVHIRGDRMYTFQFFEAIIEIVDISDKTNPILLTTIDDPGGATHSGWTTDDNNFLLVADERNGFDGRIFDIRDTENVQEVSTFTSNPDAFVHNPYVRGDFAYLAHNREGLRIYDIVDPSNPIEVGYYDTVTEENPNSGGLWSACPFSPSGKVIGGDRDLGLLVWEPTEVHASRFSGIVRDAQTLETLDSVQIFIANTTDVLVTDGFGEFKSGYPGEPTIELLFEREGYEPAIRTVALDVQNQQVIEVLLNSLGTVSTKNANLIESSIWPNPTSNIVHVNTDGSIKIEQIRILDLSGKIAFEQSVNGSKDFRVSVQDLKQGIYTVQLLDSDKRVVSMEKLVLIR